MLEAIPGLSEEVNSCFIPVVEDFSGHDNAGEPLVMSPVLLMTWTGAEKRKLLYDSISMNP